jgi:hypothetical protein
MTVIGRQDSKHDRQPINLTGAHLHGLYLPARTSSGLIRDPGSEPQMVSLIGPGLGFDPRYAMTTVLDLPVIAATLTFAVGESAGPLLNGYARQQVIPSLTFLLGARMIKVRCRLHGREGQAVQDNH